MVGLCEKFLTNGLANLENPWSCANRIFRPDIKFFDLIYFLKVSSRQIVWWYSGQFWFCRKLKNASSWIFSNFQLSFKFSTKPKLLIIPSDDLLWRDLKNILVLEFHIRHKISICARPLILMYEIFSPFPMPCLISTPNIAKTAMRQSSLAFCILSSLFSASVFEFSSSILILYQIWTPEKKLNVAEFNKNTKNLIKTIRSKQFLQWAHTKLIEFHVFTAAGSNRPDISE